MFLKYLVIFTIVMLIILYILREKLQFFRNAKKISSLVPSVSSAPLSFPKHLKTVQNSFTPLSLYGSSVNIPRQLRLGFYNSYAGDVPTSDRVTQQVITPSIIASGKN